MKTPEWNRRHRLTPLRKTILACLGAITLGTLTASSFAAGLQITRLEAQGTNAAPFELVEVQFNLPIQDGSFTTADIAEFTGPGGPVTVNSVTKITAQRYLINASGTALQSYTLRIGPDIHDAALDSLDQDGDGTAGEAVDDVFRSRVMAGNDTIATGNTAFDGFALLFALGAATVEGDHSFAHAESQRGATPLFASATTLSFRSLRADTGSSLRLGGGATVNVAGSVTVTGTSELRLKAKDNSGAVVGQFIGVGVTLNAANATIEAGSKMTADGEGYFNGNGPGYTGSGAAHGGRGASNSDFSGQPTYGNPFEPVTLGSGGSVFQAFSGGGGAIRLNITGTLTLDGEISADGSAGGNIYNGASGGSIWATIGTLAGTGKFTADGSTSSNGANQAGGGGRMIVYYTTNSSFAGFATSTVAGGGGVAQKGSLMFVDTSVANGAARVSHRFDFPAGTTRAFSARAIDSGALVELGGGSTLNIDGALTVTGNSTLRMHSRDNGGAVGGQFIGVGSTINAGSCTIDAGSVVTADGEGYFNGNSPGYTSAGSAHGGRGAENSNLSGQPTYGDGFEPVALGSGGSVFNASSLGGGAIKLNVTGTLTLNGEISADGNAGGQVFQGASGGSVWTTVGTLSGAGNFTADGTTGGGGGSPGGGGRVAVYYDSDAGFGGFLSSTVASGGGVAQKGTLLFIDTSVPGGAVRVSQRMSVAADATASFGALTIDNGALFELGGGATLDIAGALNVTGNSTLRLHSKNRDGQISGQWLGRGGTINAAAVTVAAGSVITADAEGYYNSRGPGYNGSNAGGSHGGTGANSSRLFYYGDAFEPIELGSGGNAFNNTFVAGGGAIRLNVTGPLTVNGEVTADAFSGGGAHDGASGGSIWATADTLAGSGKFTADGSQGGDPNRPSGGGGRIAVYYATDGGFGGFLTSRVTKGTPVGGPEAEHGSLLFARLTEQGPQFRISQRLFLPDDSALTGRSLTLDDAGLLEIGGNGTVIMSADVSLADGSEIRFFSKDSTAAVGGEFVGRGSRLYAGSLDIDATSKLNADKLGYSNGAGPGFGAGGASHGGLGGGSNEAKLYGDADAPLDPGSSVGGNVPEGGGGVIELVVAGELTNDGLITADAHTAIFFGVHASGGSGGSVFVRAGSVAGSGIISADGGDGTAPGAFAGGGGRIAIFCDDEPAFAAASVTVNPGTTGNPAAQAGTKVIEQRDARFVLMAPANGYAHGETTFDFAGLGYDPATTRSAVEVRRGPAMFPVGQDLGVVGRVKWNSSNANDGIAELHVTFRNASNQILGEGSAPLVINNAAQWHGGTVSSNQTWSAASVHIVEDDVLVASGATLTIEAGAVVKFLGGKRIVVRPGGVLDADAASGQSPIILTSIADDSVAGDTNFDGALTSGRPGDWLGVATEGNGQFLTSVATDIRFARFLRGGNLATQTWPSRSLNIIRTDATVDGGQTLTIQPGAVVKFELGRRMTVNGTLNAPGTFAQPIAFTSIRDDARGGDSNRDGNTTLPFATDWRQLRIVGSANFEHCFIGYAQGEGAVDGGVRVEGSATLRSCTVSDCLFSGLIVFGTAAIENTLILRTDRALDAQAGTTIARNCVIHDNRVGLFGHDGGLEAINCLVTNNTEFGVQFATSPPTVRYCNVFGNATDYAGLPNATGSNGNISADPKYRDADRDDFRLQFGSPAIDAANGTDAPLTDRTGVPRYDDPRTANTGTPTAGNSFADMGAFELIEPANVISNVDLAVSDVTAPATATAGDTVIVSWKIRNAGTETIVGPWFDTIGMRAAGGALAPAFAGEFEIGTGIVLGPGQSFTAGAAVRVPGAADGRYEWQVTTNSKGTVFEGANTANNTAVGTAGFDLTVPELILDAPALNRFFGAVNQAQWFKLRPGAGKQVRISLDLAGNGVTELFANRAAMPTEQAFTARSTEFAQPDCSLSIAGTVAQTYYIAAFPRGLAATPQSFSIQAQATALNLSGLTIDRIAGTGSVTIGFLGSLLKADATYELVGPGGTVAAGTVDLRDLSRAFATFDLNNLAPGVYKARVTSGNQTVELPNAVTVTAPAVSDPDQLEVRIVAPPAVRAGRTTSVTVVVRNKGETDIYAPLLRLTVQGWEPRPRAQTEGVQFAVARQGGSGGGGGSVSIEIIEIEYRPLPAPNIVTKQFVVMPLNPDGPAGILPPGFTSQIVLDGIPELETESITITAEDLNPAGMMDHPAAKAGYKPDNVSANAWDVIYANFVAAMGPSTLTANAALGRGATYLSSIGQRPANVDDVLSWELRKAADFGAINRRWNVGPFGYGSDPLETRLLITPGAGATPEQARFVIPRGSQRLYTQAGATAELLPGGLDKSVMTKLGNASYELRDAGGVVYRFETPGGNATELLLTYIDDPLQRRLHFGYTNGRLSSMHNGLGKQRTYTYNAAGRIDTATNEFGLTTSFTYDAQNLHLKTVTDTLGNLVTYEYYLGEGLAREHAVKSATVTGADSISFDYDSRGRLSRTTEAGGAADTLFTYDEQGGMTATDADGNQSKVSRDPAGRIVRLRNPGQALVEHFFDPFGNLSETRIADAGISHRTVFDVERHPREIYDAEGKVTRLGWDADFDVIDSHTDRLGNTISLGYDPGAGKPNLKRIEFPGGLTEERTYDAGSRLETFTNARGQTVTYEWNALNQLKKKLYPNGDYDEFFYDPVTQQTTSIIRQVGPITDSILFDYDSRRLLQKVTYPNGRFVEYTHDAFGRRDTMSTSDGYSDRWEYDSNNRLWKVRDGTGTVLITFEYDAAGRLASRTLANGASTAFSYNSADQVESVIHLRADQSLISEFVYEYDSIGNCRAIVAAEGRSEFDYDLNGQLTDARLPGGRVIHYDYDAEGNRKAVIDNGIATGYDPDHLHRYTSVGAATFTYDNDGNMTSRTAGGQTTQYAYDVDGNLTQVTEPGHVWNYEWNALGHLVAATHNGARTEFLIDPLVMGNVVAEYTSGGLTANYVHGGGLGARVEAGGSASFYLFDGGGHTSHLIGSNGATLNSYRYLPFGELNGAAVEAVPNAFRYGGRYGMRDEGNGLIHARARHYSPALGRFLSRDPAVLPLGNTYHYCNNAPVGLIDFNGAEPLQPLSADEQNIKDANDAASVAGLGLDLVNAANQAHVDKLTAEAYQALNQANKVRNAADATRAVNQHQSLLNQARNGPAAKSLSRAATAGKVLNGLGLLAEGSQLFLGDGTKPGVIDRMRNGNNYDRGFAAAETTLFVAKNGLKALTSEIPFSGELIDGSVAIVDYGSQWAFEKYFSNEYGDKPPEDVFGDAYWRHKKGIQVRVIRSEDPNDITGPAGFGPEMWIDDNGVMHFTIRFENLATAAAAAYRVAVTLPLDANLDASSFTLDRFGFAGTEVDVPPNRKFFASSADVTTDPNPVKIIAGLDAQTRTVTWVFESFDAVTGELPEDPYAGFLPPNNANGDGEGFVTFTIKPKSGPAQPFDILAQASIVFDTNPAIATNTHTNRIETGTPVAAMVSLPATIPFGRGGFLVRWGGSGSFSGIASYDVFASDNGSPLAIWLDDTSLTSAVYPGVAGHTYAFVVVATDNVGQSSILPVTAEIQTLMGTTPLFVSATYLCSISHADATAQIEGLLRTTITRGGSVTGSIRFNGKLWSFAGRLDAMNRITVPLRNSQPALELRFQHYYGIGAAELRGVLASPAFEAPFQASANLYTKLNPCPAAGRFTSLLDPDPGAVNPAAPLTEGGYSTLNISTLGAVTLAGRLANNITFSASSTIAPEGSAPLYVVLPGKQGFIVGGPQFANLTNSFFDGGLDWHKALFLTTLELQHPVLITGSRYIRTVPIFPLPIDADVLIDGGGLTNPLAANFTFNSHGAISMTGGGGPQKIRLTLNYANGLLSGSFLFPGATTSIPLRGALLQTQQLGGGFFLRNGVPGSFSVTK